MVIIAREFAVTGLRLVAAEQGVVIQASWLGKVKTILQVAAIICLIAVDPAPLGVDLLVYAAVAVTVISGIDYFFGFKRMVASKPAEADCLGRRRGLEPLPHGGVVAGVRAALELAGDLGEQAVALGDHVVAVDGLEVLLAGVDEGAVAELAGRSR